MRLYLQILHGKCGPADGDSEDWAPALRLALDLERKQEADEFAKAIIAHQATGFFEDYDHLGIPCKAETPKSRIAYALLVVGLDRSVNQDRVGNLNYCRRAQALLPSNTIVRVHLAFAYHERAGKGDYEQCRALFHQAYKAEASQAVRSQIQSLAYDLSVGKLE